MGRQRAVQTALKGIEAVGLTKPAFRLRERVRARRATDAPGIGADGLPLPPPLLMVRVVGHADSDAFQTHGRACSDTVRRFVSEQQQGLADAGAMLDFGCGCGRVVRHWADLRDVRIVGTDSNPELVDWCNENLPFVEARLNAEVPPLPARDSEFELAYAFSVFTHLRETAQLGWMRELERVLRPGGLLLFTTKGDVHARRQLTGASLNRYLAGEFVATSPRAAGTNLCAAYTPRTWVERHLLGNLELLRHHEGIPAVMDSQEIYLVRRPERSE
jgi:SAM-dependent methyltransferase